MNPLFLVTTLIALTSVSAMPTPRPQDSSQSGAISHYGGGAPGFGAVQQEIAELDDGR